MIGSFYLFLLFDPSFFLFDQITGFFFRL